MATKAQAVDLKKIDNEELNRQLKEAQEWLEQLKNTQTSRIDSMREDALAELKAVLEKNSNVLDADIIRDYLVDNEFITMPEPVVVKSGAAVGRRKIDKPVFTIAYTGKGGNSQTHKMDEISKLPASTSAGYTAIVALRGKTLQEQYSHFSAHGKEWFKTDPTKAKEFFKMLFPEYDETSLDDLLNPKPKAEGEAPAVEAQAPKAEETQA